jgi:hypothetical protein
MGLPFETPGGYADDGATPDTGMHTDDLTEPDYDGHSRDTSGDATSDYGDFDDFEEEEDFAEDWQGDQAGWDPGAGRTGNREQT